MLYLLDANVLITANNTYYPIERVPEFWEWLLHHGGNGTIKIPLEVMEEIEVGNGTDPLCSWIQDISVASAVTLDEEVHGATLQRVVREGYAPDLTDDEVEKLGRDPFLISYAIR